MGDQNTTQFPSPWAGGALRVCRSTSHSYATCRYMADANVGPTPTLNTRYTVWAFVVGQISGPRRMTITHEGSNDVGILAEQTVFSLGATIRKWHVSVDNKLFRVYFDITRHEIDHENATYVFLRMPQQRKFISICAEDDMAHLLELWLRYIQLQSDGWQNWLPCYIQTPLLFSVQHCPQHMVCKCHQWMEMGHTQLQEKGTWSFLPKKHWHHRPLTCHNAKDLHLLLCLVSLSTKFSVIAMFGILCSWAALLAHMALGSANIYHIALIKLSSLLSQMSVSSMKH